MSPWSGLFLAANLRSLRDESRKVTIFVLLWGLAFGSA